MKKLFFAGTFAFAIFLAYGLESNSQGFPGTRSGINLQANYDTTPKSKKDSLKKKKNWGKDSTSTKDTSRPIPDSTNHQ